MGDHSHLDIRPEAAVGQRLLVIVDTPPPPRLTDHQTQFLRLIARELRLLMIANSA